MSYVQEEEDDDLVILPEVDNSELISRFQLSLVGRLFNREWRSVEALIALLPRPNIWDVEGRARGVDLGNHRFQFSFDSEEDLLKVLSKRPCHFNKWSFALERWAPHIGDSFPSTMTFWEENCPQFSEAQREHHRQPKETSREKYKHQQPRMESNRNGDITKRLNAADQKGDVTQRDNRDRVWKRIDSWYAPRDDHRENTQHTSRYQDKSSYGKETYNKRRYDDSFAATKHREEAKKASITISSKGEKALEHVRERATSSHRPETGTLQSALLISASPEHVRERPFRLSLQKKPSEDLKLKAKVYDLGDSSDSISSARKSLTFNDATNPSETKTQPISVGICEEEKKTKSWYEQTLKEEEECLEKKSKEENITDLSDQKLTEKKILEEEDWMNHDVASDDEDLMDEDDLLLDEEKKLEEEKIISRKFSPGSMPDTAFEPEKQPKVKESLRSLQKRSKSLSPSMKMTGSPNSARVGMSFETEKNLPKHTRKHSTPSAPFVPAKKMTRSWYDQTLEEDESMEEDAIEFLADQGLGENTMMKMI
ncbi:hypothetical protein N665_0016s0048 [Sinapis alba]|nr:hypothetical protein N665_0016s0048 [Sinapis alba]